MTILTLDQVMAKADSLPALPQIVIRILDDLANDQANVETLSGHVASDPAIVARLLSAANGAGVAHGNRVVSVRQAMMLLGVARVRNIVMTTAIIDRFKTASTFDSQRLWLHSVGVAICAQHIAEKGGVDPDAAYTAGLLHDIGQLLLFAVDSAAYSEAMKLRREKDLDVIAAERECFGIDHAQVGGELAKLWHLPETVADGIAGHHASDEVTPETEIADAIHIAEVLAHALDLGHVPGDRDTEGPRVPYLSDISCARMGIEWPDMIELFPQIEARFDCARLTLGV
jgi:putative nucleotidyltransferase with HDIG domain